MARQTAGVLYDGIVVLEDLSFVEQVQLFRRTRIFVFRHGSCLINLLWNRPDAIVFEMNDGHHGFSGCIRRLCQFTQATHYVVPYPPPTIDTYRKEIFGVFWSKT